MILTIILILMCAASKVAEAHPADGERGPRGGDGEPGRQGADQRRDRLGLRRAQGLREAAHLDLCARAIHPGE